MAKVAEKLGGKRALDLHLWAVKVWWKIEPKLFITVICNSFVEAVTPFVVVWFSAQIINELAGARRTEELWSWVGLTVLVTAVLSILGTCLKRWKEAVHSTESQLEDWMFSERLLNMDYAAVEAASTKDILNEMHYHCMGNVYGFCKVQHYYFEEIVRAITSILSAVVLLWDFFASKVPVTEAGYVWLNHPAINVALVAILVGGVLLAQSRRGKVNQFYNDELYPFNNMHNRYCQYMGTLGSKWDRQMDVRIYNQQDVAWKAMKKHDHCVKGHVGAHNYHILGLLSASGDMIDKLLFGITYLFVGLKAWAGAFGIGDATQYVGAITAVCSGMVGMFFVMADLEMNAGYLDAIKKFLEIPNDMYQGSLTTEKRSDRNYEVEFKNVSFKYPGTDAWALKNVSVKFRIGSHLAIVGENGSGKSTFIKLLCRLYDPQEGQILLNGIDIHKYKYEDYREVFSVVFQDFNLLAASLGSNVAGKEKYEEGKVLQALSDAGFSERLKEMPKGLDTQIYKEFDEEGVMVSGGEAQKIAIARALYKNAPFIILDEPTAALDPMAEAEIYAQFHQISGDKTSIYISHRLSSCRFCEEILVFDKGSIVERGSHENLLKNSNGKYYALWNAQAQYYI